MRSFIMGINNLIRWAPIIWKDRDWDWWYLAAIMRFKLASMADHAEQAFPDTQREHDVRCMRLCAALLKRLQEDNYLNNAHQIHGERAFRALTHATEQERQDVKHLGKILGKHMLCWWF